MQLVSSADFQRQLGHYQDRALVEPVVVTRNGRERVVLMSADEFRRLKQLDLQEARRQSLLASQQPGEATALAFIDEAAETGVGP